LLLADDVCLLSRPGGAIGKIIWEYWLCCVFVADVMESGEWAWARSERGGGEVTLESGRARVARRRRPLLPGSRPAQAFLKKKILLQRQVL
jgi:hypothetical protein